ncbi:DUF6973 domain-containing protein [Wenyingzhuangia sp. IMCC45574]
MYLNFKNYEKQKTKNKKTLIALILVVGFSVCSCQDTIEQEVEGVEETTLQTSHIIDYKGLQVNHRFSTPVEELLLEKETTGEELTAKYTRIKHKLEVKYNPNLTGVRSGIQPISTVKNEEFPSGEMIIEGVKNVIDQFPYDVELLKQTEEDFKTEISPLVFKDSLTVEEYEELLRLQDLDSIALAQHELLYQQEKEAKMEANMEMIKQDFPTLSDESIEDNIDLIDEYYQKNMDYMALEEVAAHEGEITTNLEQRVPKVARRSVITPVVATVGIGILAAVVNKKYKDLSATEKCVYNKVVSKYGMLGAYIGNKAGENARHKARRYYAGQHEKLTRLDAFRHTYWNALMCKNFVTLSTSKSKRMNFAKFISEALYDCGDVYDATKVGIDSRAMDRHNDNVGRRIYDKNTKRIKFWKWTIGLREPSYSRLRSVIRDRIHKSSDYIVQYHPEDNDVESSVNYGGIYDYSVEELVNKIQKIHDDRPVYYRKTIAAPYYTYKRYLYRSKYTIRFRIGYIKTINYPTFHSKDSDLTYGVLSKQTTDYSSDR